MFTSGQTNNKPTVQKCSTLPHSHQPTQPKTHPNTRKRKAHRSLVFIATLIAGVALLLAQPTVAIAASSAWKIVTSPNGSTTPVSNNLLSGVAAISDTDVWAVGDFNSTDDNVINHTLAEHWNGTAWSIVPSPNVGTMGSSLSAVSAASSKDVWAVGTVQTDDSANGNRTLIEHWNGSAWSVVPSPNPSSRSDNLTGVAAISATNAWAVGWYENDEQSALLPIISHWDGTSWSLAPSIPAISMITTAITTRSATDIWVVGHDPGETSSIALHFNGQQWSNTSATGFSSSQVIIRGVAAPASNNAWMVGSFTPAVVGAYLQPLALHWNGTTWSMVTVPNPSPYTNQLFAVASISTTDVWAVGQENTPDGLNLHTLVEHWNGKQWAIVASPNLPATGTAFDGLLGITASGPTSLWAVGGFDSLVQGNPGERTLIQHNTQG
jgi:hypothetical protein